MEVSGQLHVREAFWAPEPVERYGEEKDISLLPGIKISCLASEVYSLLISLKIEVLFAKFLFRIPIELPATFTDVFMVFSFLEMNTVIVHDYICVFSRSWIIQELGLEDNICSFHSGGARLQSRMEH